MKHFATIALVFITALAFGQAPAPTPAPAPADAPLLKNVYFAGFAYNPAGSPKVAGDFGYGRLLDSAGTYSFSSVDVLPLKGQPSAVSTTISTGVAQKVFSLGKAKAFVLSQIGFQTDGKNAGWDWNGGVALDYPLKGGFGVLPALKFDKGSATENYGYRYIASLNFRFGK